MVVKYMKLLVLTIFFLMSTSVFACTCGNYQSLSEQFDSADIVVLARLRAVEEATFEWEITESIKGVKPNTLGSAEQGGTSCDPRLEEGQEWLLFLNNGEKPILGWCSFNRNLEFLDSNWREELKSNH